MTGWRRLALAATLLLLTQLLSGCASPGSSSSISDCIDPGASRSPDLRRNLAKIRQAPLCYRRQEVHEGRFHWTFHIIEHREQPDGPFWVLPHDDENTAFDIALSTVIDYGGGLLSVDSGGRRTFRGQDPNRNFSRTRSEANRCRGQRDPAPGYTQAVLSHYRHRSGPIFAMHNNHDGWEGNGGRGTISMARRSAAMTVFHGRGPQAVSDEDNLIFMAGQRPLAADPTRKRQAKALQAAGLNVIDKQVRPSNFDCSLSDYVALNLSRDYYNIEAEHGDAKAQRQMAQRLLRELGIPRRGAQGPVSPFLQ